MKQYAAHRVYLAGTEEWCNGPQVVSVSEGKVLSLFPFSGEIPSVEWLGGLLIVALVCLNVWKQNPCPIS